MVVAALNQPALVRRAVEHRTEPRIVLQMEPVPAGNAKMKPTVFLPSLLTRRMEPQAQR